MEIEDASDDDFETSKPRTSKMNAAATTTAATTTNAAAGIFEVDKDFCSFCGSILPVPDYGARVTCHRCGQSFSMANFTGILSQRTIQITKSRKKETKDDAKEKVAKSVGPLVDDRKCGKCGHMGMTYFTMQTRSVDEGQTVFYSCPGCNSQEIEYS